MKDMDADLAGSEGRHSLTSKLLIPSFADPSSNDGFRPSPIRPFPAAPQSAGSECATVPPSPRPPQWSSQSSPRTFPPPREGSNYGVEGHAPMAPDVAATEAEMNQIAKTMVGSEEQIVPLSRFSAGEESMLNHTGATADDMGTVTDKLSAEDILPGYSEEVSIAESANKNDDDNNEEVSPFGKLRQGKKSSVEPDSTPALILLQSPPKMTRKSTGITNDHSPRLAQLSKTSGVSAPSSEIASVSMTTVTSVLGCRYLDSEDGSTAHFGNVVNTKLMNEKAMRLKDQVQKDDNDRTENPLTGRNSANSGNVSKVNSDKATASFPLSYSTNVADSEEETKLSMENLSRLDSSHGENSSHSTVKQQDREEVNSLTSIMGSDSGLRQIRLDEVNAMELLVEVDEESNENEAPKDVKREISSTQKSAVQLNMMHDAYTTEGLLGSHCLDDLALPVLNDVHLATEKVQNRSQSLSSQPPSPIDAGAVSASAAVQPLRVVAAAASAGGSSRTSPGLSIVSPGACSRTNDGDGATAPREIQVDRRLLYESGRESSSPYGGSIALSPRFSPSLSPAYQRTPSLLELSPQPRKDDTLTQNHISPLQQAHRGMSFDRFIAGTDFINTLPTTEF